MSAADALAYVDKALDNVADLDVIWENREVIEMLEDIRSLMLTGEPLPGLFIMATDRENRAETKHTESCGERCNHCQVCGDSILYGSRCPTHYQVTDREDGSRDV